MLSTHSSIQEDCQVTLPLETETPWVGFQVSTPAEDKFLFVRESFYPW